ncbi:MAG: DUF3108 domain-containing protein [Stellaceae bacterium]
MRPLGALLGLLLLAAPSAAGAQAPVSLRLTYLTYARGFTTLKLVATLELSAAGYQVAIGYHTLGMVGFFFPGHDTAQAAGSWQAGKAAPLRFASEGAWGGRPFDVEITYPGGVPEVRRLVPTEARKRESVPAALRQQTIDTVSAIALLLARVADGEGCRLAVKVFDGRRLMTLDATQAGSQTLGATTRSFFHGTAERCDVTGRMLAGFLRSDGPAERKKVDHGAVWFAHPVPGLPVLPVRIAFSTQWFGTAMMYLTGIQTSPVMPTGPARVAQSASPEGAANQ